jgi:hypothetical protein
LPSGKAGQTVPGEKKKSFIKTGPC